MCSLEESKGMRLMKVLKSLIDETAILSGICSTDPQRDRYVFFFRKVFTRVAS